MAPPIEVTATWGTSVPAAWSILVHGGAGDLQDSDCEAHAKGCEEAARAGAEILNRGGSALDAVERAVQKLEKNPIFNAGKGASLTDAGTIELDASIMSGADLRAGAVCSLPPFYNPISIARQVLEAGGPVLLSANGAERFAIARGFSPCADADLITPKAKKRWETLRSKGESAGYAGGTVGAVAFDVQGHVAAATSTGGMMNKPRGRVGDSPLIGAGTYADDRSGACSNTGDGEAVIRLVLAREACFYVQDTNKDARQVGTHLPEVAARKAIALLGERTQATGGMIFVDAKGRMGLARSTKTMSWAAHSAGWPDARSGT
ncbi:MAG: isoaspartyl peptidase/L-asparaginase family protein [Polyangiaceae bacterium]